jgi:hypothetical protein
MAVLPERLIDARLLQEQADLAKVLETSRERVGVDPLDLRHVVGAALSRAGFDLGKAEAASVGHLHTYRFDPTDPAFAKDAGWDDAFDDLRIRPRKRDERMGNWRRNAPIRNIAFEPPILPDGRDADNVVQVHVEHRLVRRLLSRFLSQGFQSNLSRGQRDPRARRAAASRAVGPACCLWAGCRAAARGDHPDHRRLDGSRSRPQAAEAVRRSR